MALTPAMRRSIDRRISRAFGRRGIGGKVVLWGGHPERTVPAGGVIDRGRELARRVLDETTSC